MSLSAFGFLHPTFFFLPLIHYCWLKRKPKKGKTVTRKELRQKNTGVWWEKNDDNYCNVIVSHHSTFSCVFPINSYLFTPLLLFSRSHSHCVWFRIIIINMKASLCHKHNTHDSPIPHTPFSNEEDLQSQTLKGEKVRKKIYANTIFLHFKVTCNGKKTTAVYCS